VFHASGDLILGRAFPVPIKIQIMSLDGIIPVVAELTADSGQAELFLRNGFGKRAVNLKVCGREFSVRLVGRPKNSPLHKILASDLFAGLFPAAEWLKKLSNG
jgi:hypothetical protein